MLEEKYNQILLCEGLNHKLALERYKKRRDSIMALFNFPVIITGIDIPLGHLHDWALFSPFIYQEPFMLFLTGINQANVVLVLDPKTKKETLFLDTKNLDLEFWEGLKFGYEKDNTENKKILGIEIIESLSNLEKYLKNLSPKQLGAFWFESKKGKVKEEHNYQFKEKISTWLPQTNIHNIAEKTWPLRLSLDSTDKENLITANKKTNTVFQETLKHLHTYDSEHQLAAILNGNILKESVFGESFPSIVAGGKNATVLHYTKNNEKFKGNELVLMDFGCRWHTVTADISRTIPKNGKFNPLQRICYNIVLEAQKLVEKNACKKITIENLNTLCWNFIYEELVNKIQKKGGKFTLLYDKRPHGVSHLIGHQVHDGDPFRDYGTIELKDGYVISNEPGLYGHFELTIDGKFYDEWIGIRIEDNLMITESGCENLSVGIPKEIDEIEALLIN